MRKLYFGFLSMVFALIAINVSAQTVVSQQSFEGTTSDDWNYTVTPTNFNGGGDIWDTVTTLPNVASMPTAGSYFWGVRDLNSPNGTTGFAEINFDTVHTSSISTGYIAFDYDIYQFDSGDDVQYEVFANGTSLGVDTIIDGFSNLSAVGTVNVAIPSNTDSVRLKLYVKQNGGSDYAGFDNFRVMSGSIPTPPSTPFYNIADINNVDANGVADSLNVTCFTQGLVLGVDLNSGGGYSFTLWDGEGIGVYNNSDVNGYSVQEGDSIIIRGTVDQFNGLTQLGSIDSISVVNTGNALPSPAVITALDETTESKLVRFDNAEITADLGFGNWEAVSGMDTITMRIETETNVDDSVSLAVGDSLCYIIGLGGQYDSNSPYNEGYQLIPRYFADVDTTCGSSSNPPAPSTDPFYNIADINNVDANGVADSLNVTCFTQGLVLGVDLNSGGGYSFTLWDGEGIGVYNNSDVNGYSVQEGDSIIIRGTVDQFNGLTQLGSIDSISVVNTGNALPSPAVITALDETTESKLVRFDNAEITADLGFGNWEAVSGMDTITMRIETETNVDDSVSLAVGDSLCYIIGIGGQYDNNSPYTEGYQMIPRYFADVDTTCGSSSSTPTPTGTPFYNIADINNVDANGVADSLGVECFTKGVVLGVNLRTSGYQFTLWDNEGIGVFNFSDVNGYTVQEGDSIIIKGEVDQYNGLTQMGSIDSIHVVNSGNPLPSPSVVTSLDESTESEPIQINNVLVTGVSGSNFEIVNATDTMTMRIDTETGIFNDITPAVGDSLCSIVGIGGQFDGSSPYTSGYQIFPMYSSDLDTTCGGVTPPAVDLNIYPIGDVTTVDANGEPDSLGVVCGVQGVVTTIDFRVSGYELYIQDATGGINVFSFSDYNNVQPLMGDSLLVWGEIDQYNGLTEIIVDSLEVLNSGNSIPNHKLVNTITESVEGEIVEIQDFVVNSVDSTNAGTGAINYGINKGQDSLTLRVRDITGINDMITLNVGDTLCSAKGAASQYDDQAPLFDEYQLLPVQMSDLTVNNCDSIENSIGEVAEKTELRAYPNPTNNMLNFNKTIDFVMFNALGEEVKRATRVRRINVSDLTNGIYFIKSEDTVLKVIVK
ncbi:T9SS type A sorting domain-containing protein [Salibacter halophilus]|uniref:T9SS type A sorting domain-containing protein n=1 Tax=Salibacter halophilus TaxID=1803916 RepID=A0A6N6M7X8_9FLAO|nr:T9SS type A sorting domain-containing protein [Salibacter halophilus]KAB1063937.1 T9SS type A sorting domain-containing protein [Salibacter halophilus]